jgi:dinuclear metal center YbgI/SA1388 family protein
MPTIADLVRSLESIAPLRLAASWDNAGLLLGDAQWPLRRALLTIDLTGLVLDEAIESKADAIIAYHPPLFEPIKSITASDPRSAILLRSAREGIAIYSPHTALDAAEGGLNDWLAAMLTGETSAALPGRGSGSGSSTNPPHASADIRALQSHEELPSTEETKIITFCPQDAADRLRSALASVGAGRIGDYSVCSFEMPGSGTFLGGDSTNPTLGERGRLERVNEVRLEMVCPKRSLALAVIAIRQFHPYEEPPIEIHPLLPRPQRHVGQGRRIVLDKAVPLRAILDRIRKGLGRSRLQVAEGRDAPAKYQTIGLCAGAGGSLANEAIRDGCRMFFTGEMRHHDILDATARGCTIVLAGHTNTERGYLKILRTRLSALVPNVAFIVSKKDADPLKVM